MSVFCRTFWSNMGISATISREKNSQKSWAKMQADPCRTVNLSEEYCNRLVDWLRVKLAQQMTKLYCMEPRGHWWLGPGEQPPHDWPPAWSGETFTASKEVSHQGVELSPPSLPGPRWLAGWKLSPHACEQLQKEVIYLRHTISEGISAD